MVYCFNFDSREKINPQFIPIEELLNNQVNHISDSERMGVTYTTFVQAYMKNPVFSFLARSIRRSIVRGSNLSITHESNAAEFLGNEQGKQRL
jgi:hypothetical protein